MNKQKIMVGILVPIVFSSIILTSTLTSCKNNTSQNTQQNDKGPGSAVDKNKLSSFIQDKNRNDFLKLNDYTLVPYRNIHPVQSSSNILINDNFFINSVQFKEKINELIKNKDLIENSFKNESTNYLKDILRKNYLSSNDLIVNYEFKNNNELILIFQIQNNKQANLEFMIGGQKIEVSPGSYFACKTIFNFLNFNIVEKNNWLVYEQIKGESWIDINNKISKLDYPIFDMNNKNNFLNTEFSSLTSDVNSDREIQNKISEFINDNNFNEHLKTSIINNINSKWNIILANVDIVQSIADLLISNPTLKVFLNNLSTPIYNILLSNGVNKYLSGFIGLLLNEQGTGKNIKEYIDYLSKNNLVDEQFYKISSFIAEIIKEQTFVDFILGISVDDLNLLIGLLDKVLPIEFKPIINWVLDYIKLLHSISPNNDISKLDLLSTLLNPAIVEKIPDLLNIIKPLLPINIVNIFNKIELIFPEIKSNLTIDNIKGLLNSIFNPKMNNNSINLNEYLKTQVTLTTNKNNIVSQTNILSIDSEIQMQFKNDLIFDMTYLKNIFRNLKITTLLSILNINIPSGLNSIINMLGTVGEVLPSNIQLSSMDSVKYIVSDSEASIILYNNGYELVAKQGVIVSFKNTLNNIYNKVLSNFSFLTKPLIKKFADPYINVLKNYYLDLMYNSSLINFESSDIYKMDYKNVYDGTNILKENSESLNILTTTILPNYIFGELNKKQNKTNLDVTLDQQTKQIILNAIGISTEKYLNNTHFDVLITPNFDTNASSTTLSSIKTIDIKLTFSTPVLILTSSGYQWTNTYYISNISTQQPTL